MQRFFLAALLALPALLPAAPGRTLWSTSRIRGTPEPPAPYTLERAFPHLTFANPMEAATIPGTQRLLLLEQKGKLLSFAADSATGTPDTVLDLHTFEPKMQESYALAFHPQFLTNRHVYVMFMLLENGKPNLENGSRIVRFTLPDTLPHRIDPASGVTVFRWTSGGHNGCGIRFGPDGMLYISTGDGGFAEPPDPLVTGQNLTDVLSCVLRIDVDHPGADQPYSIPADNPFVKTQGARGEIWAYGLRNPWRIAFDPHSGELYAGDVGWERWEMIHRIVRGGNSGWSITEATRQEVRPERTPGPTPIRAPLAAHPHEDAASITGGEFYHGSRHPDLRGHYLYADWQMGTFWALKADGDTVLSHRPIARSPLMPAGFATLPDREILACDHAGGGLWRLVPNPEVHSQHPFPTRLSQTGLFTDTPAQTPAPGVLPYFVKAPRWNDYATSARWIGLPSPDAVTVAALDLGVQRAGRWVFPKDTVLAKTYFLETETGNPASRRRVETQVLHFNGPQAAAYTYRWNAEQTDAELVPAQGAEQTFAVKDPAFPGGVRNQLWRFNSRSECIRCHTVWNDFTPGYQPFQLDTPVASAPGNQLDQLAALGLAPHRPLLVDPDDESAPLATRARSYLHTNCATCHRKNGGGAVPTYFDIELTLKESRLLDQPPVQGELGLPEGRVLAQGDPERSVLLYRMAMTGRGHMPYVGSRLVDEKGLRLVRDWIASLRSQSQSLTPETRKQRDREHKLLADLKAGDSRALEPLLASASGALSVALALNDNALPGGLRDEAIRTGAALADPFRRELFERFLAPDQKRRTLGTEFDAGQVLSTAGNAPRGKPVFQALCAACHKAQDLGIDFGPDLAAAAKRYSPADLLDHIRHPSKTIEPAWQLATVTLDSSEIKTGFITGRSAAGLILRQAGGVNETLPATRIQNVRTEAKVSLMPEGLLQSSTAQEAADLLAWLRSLAQP